jgi:hypothetical protein
MADTWEVQRLREILPTASRVPDYSEKPITQKWPSYAYLIIEILAWIQNSSLIYLGAVDVWGRWIAQCGGMRKQHWRHTVRSVPLLQEVIIGTQLSNICIKLEKLHTWRYLPASSKWCTASTPRDVTMFHWFGRSGFGRTDWMRTGARTPLLGIGPTVHHLVVQSKPVIKVSIINWHYLT